MANVRTEEVKLTVDGSEMRRFRGASRGGGAAAGGDRVRGDLRRQRAHPRRHQARGAPRATWRSRPTITIAPGRRGRSSRYNDEGMKQGMALIPKLTFDGHRGRRRRHHRLLEDAQRGERRQARRHRLLHRRAHGLPGGGDEAGRGDGLVLRRRHRHVRPGRRPRRPIERTGDIKGKIICFFGKDDPMIPQDQVADDRQGARGEPGAPRSRGIRRRVARLLLRRRSGHAIARRRRRTRGSAPRSCSKRSWAER